MSLEKVMKALVRLNNDKPEHLNEQYKTFWQVYNTLPSAKHLMGTKGNGYRITMAKKYGYCLKKCYEQKTWELK